MSDEQHPAARSHLHTAEAGAHTDLIARCTETLSPHTNRVWGENAARTTFRDSSVPRVTLPRASGA